MGFDEGHFVFDSSKLTYYTGQIVYGKLVFDQDKVKTFRGIYVKVKGYCDVHWTSTNTRTVNDRRERYTKNHNSHETYFENKIYLIGSKDGEVNLQPGHHEFPFQCQIPIQCPSTYNGGNGHIRYEVKAVVDRSIKFDQEKTATLTVIAARDLNVDPYCKEPMVFDFKESYCSCCMSSGTCEVVARIPQSGYCSGQTVNIDLNCSNRSNVEIDEIKFEIKEKIIFRATHEPDTRQDKKVIAKLKKGPIPANTTRNWALELEIPQMEVNNLDACSFIDIDYKFEVTVSPSGCHSDTSASRRLVLGTIPLREFDTNVPNPGYQNGQPAVLPVPNQPYVTPNQVYPSPNQVYPSPNQMYPSPNQMYPSPNQVYPSPNQVHPSPNQVHPSPNQVHPSPNQMHPSPNQVHPSPNQVHPSPNQVHPSPYQVHPSPIQRSPSPNQHHTAGNPYPAGISPYPTGSPYPGGNPLYPGGNQPCPGISPPYPVENPAPYPNVTPTTAGFRAPGHEDKDSVTGPLLPPTAAMPYSPMPSPFATATAPEPGTPDFIRDKMPMPTTPKYNPDVKSENH